jgi:hypothetical protein
MSDVFLKTTGINAVVSFSSTVDGGVQDTALNKTLRVQAAGGVSFASNVGGIVPLAGLITLGTATTTLIQLEHVPALT